jgi:hypothetical protein
MMNQQSENNGPIVAAMLAAGIGCFVLGIMVSLGQGSKALDWSLASLSGFLSGTSRSLVSGPRAGASSAEGHASLSPPALLAVLSPPVFFVQLLTVPLAHQVHPPPVTRKPRRPPDHFPQRPKQSRVPLVKGGVGLLGVVTDTVPFNAEEVPVNAAVLGGEEQLSRLW